MVRIGFACYLCVEQIAWAYWLKIWTAGLADVAVGHRYVRRRLFVVLWNMFVGIVLRLAASRKESHANVRRERGLYVLPSPWGSRYSDVKSMLC